MGWARGFKIESKGCNQPPEAPRLPRNPPPDTPTAHSTIRGPRGEPQTTGQTREKSQGGRVRAAGSPRSQEEEAGNLPSPPRGGRRPARQGPDIAVGGLRRVQEDGAAGNPHQGGHTTRRFAAFFGPFFHPKSKFFHFFLFAFRFSSFRMSRDSSATPSPQTEVKIPMESRGEYREGPPKPRGREAALVRKRGSARRPLPGKPRSRREGPRSPVRGGTCPLGSGIPRRRRRRADLGLLTGHPENGPGEPGPRSPRVARFFPRRFPLLPP